jgi:hypothetical protein
LTFVVQGDGLLVVGPVAKINVFAPEIGAKSADKSKSRRIRRCSGSKWDSNRLLLK